MITTESLRLFDLVFDAGPPGAPALLLTIRFCLSLEATITD